MAHYSVTLTFQPPEVVVYQGHEVFRLVCDASAPIGMPVEIFAHQKSLIDPVTEEQQDEFSFICSPYELSAYPANAPNFTQSPQFFRKAGYDFLLPDIEAYESVKQSTIDQVTALINRMYALDKLSVTEVITVSSGESPFSSTSIS